MRYQALILLVTLVTFAVVSTTTALCIGLWWSTRKPSLIQLPAVVRARGLFWLRLTPLAVGLIACAVAALAFLRHEPRATIETPGWMLLTAASLGVGVAALGLSRLIVRLRATYRFLQTLKRTATRVALPGVPLPTWQLDTAFPLVAVAGIWRPYLLVARRVLEHVPADELQVILNHELAHARRRDNAAQLLMTGLPDVLSLVQGGIERAWHEAVEDAADELATGNDTQARVCLAAALIRVARMAGTHAVPAGPLLAFHTGESVERRVRRLLNGPQARSAPPLLLLAFVTVPLLLGLFGFWLTADVVLLSVHRAIEWLVNVRP